MPQWVRWLWLSLGALALLVLCLTVLRDVLLLVALALLLTTGLLPIVRFLERRRLPHAIAVMATLAGVMAVAVALVALVLPLIVEEGLSLIAALPGYAENLKWVRTAWADWSAQFPFLPTVGELTDWVAARVGGFAQGLLSVTGQVVAVVVSAATVAILLFYLLHDGHKLRDQGLLLVPPYQRDAARELLDLLADRIGHFTLGTLADMTVVGLLTAFGLSVIGVPDALVLGAIVAVFNILPYVGATLGSIPGLIVAFGVSPQLGLMALAVYVVVQQLEGMVIYPNVVGKVVDLHPMYVLLALAVGTQVLGIAGVFLGIPAALVIKTLLEVRIIPAIQRMTPPVGVYEVAAPPVAAPASEEPGPA